MIALRDYQLAAIEQLRNGIRQAHLCQVLQLSTGGGKTAIASHMIKSAVEKGKVCWFICDSLELIDQAVQAFGRDGMESNIGVKQGDHYLTDDSRAVQVCTIQTLRARWEDTPDHRRPNLVIIDECHVLHNAHIEIMEWAKLNRVPVIGLSATPFRKGLGQHFSNLVIGATTKFLTDNGFLKPAVCFAPNIPDLSEVALKGGSDSDWKEDGLADVMQGEQLMGDIVQHWLDYAQGRQTLAFGCNVAHSRAMAERFRAAGIRSMHVDGYMKEEERTAIIDQYKKGAIQILCNVAVLTKGFDDPVTSCIIVARPTKSLMLHIQILGRGLRVGGSEDCIVLDHAGNCIRNGLPTDELPTMLDQGNKGMNPDRKDADKPEKMPKPCFKCQALIMGRHCPHCFAEQPLPVRNVDHVDGELVQIGGKKAKKRTFSPDEKAMIYAQFMLYATQHGRSPGWAWHAVRDYCGSAPRDQSQKVSVISPEIASWIRSRNIAYSKRMKA